MIWRLTQALSVPAELAQDAAVVTEFMIGALDVVDDVIDDESRADNASRAINAGIALLALAHAAGGELAKRLPADQGGLVGPCLSNALLVSTAGEDLDILFESDPTVDEAAALAMTEKKSGPLVAMAFELAGILHTSDPALLARLAEIGRQVGLLNQLDNDLQGCTKDGALACSDLRLRKKTLPVAYALRCRPLDGAEDFRRFFQEPASPRLADASQLDMVQRYLASCGALHYTWVVAQTIQRDLLALLAQMVGQGQQPLADACRALIPPLPAMSNQAHVSAVARLAGTRPGVS